MTQKTRQSGFSVVEVLLVLLVVALVGVIGWLVWSKNSSPTSTQSNNTAAKSVEIPELHIKIADPENRGLAVFYNDTGAKANCAANRNYYANNVCDNYLMSTRCEDMNVEDGTTCSYYIYDNTTYNPASASSVNPTEWAKYFKCDSDLTIYATSAQYADKAPTDLSATVKVGDKYISVWAHEPGIHSTCDEASAASAAAEIKNLLQYVKSNVSAL